MSDEELTVAAVVIIVALGFLTWWLWKRVWMGVRLIFEIAVTFYGVLGISVLVIFLIILPIVTIPLLIIVAFWLGRKKFQFDREDKQAIQDAIPTDPEEYIKWQNREPPYDR